MKDFVPCDRSPENKNQLYKQNQNLYKKNDARVTVANLTA